MGKFQVKRLKAFSRSGGRIGSKMLPNDVTFYIHINLLSLQNKIHKHVCFHHLMRKITFPFRKITETLENLESHLNK